MFITGWENKAKEKFTSIDLLTRPYRLGMRVNKSMLVYCFTTKNIHLWENL
jgi:hypothetical protein